MKFMYLSKELALFGDETYSRFVDLKSKKCSKPEIEVREQVSPII